MTARDESLAVRWGRRVLTIPGVAIAALALLALLPLLAPLLALRDALRGNRFAALRGAACVAWYLGCEVVGLAAAALLWLAAPLGADRVERATFALQRSWAAAIFGAIRRLFALRVEVGDAPAADAGPLLVLMRHASLVDSLLPAALLSARTGLRLRYVMKRELLWDPCLDVIGQRLPNCFVRRGSGDGAGEIARVGELARDLGPDAGVLIYPEGTRYTPERRQQLLMRFAARGETKLLERAQALQHLLPPRLGGVGALLDAAPHADVLLCVHTGLEGVRGLRDLLGGALLGRRVQVQLWRLPAASIPREPAARSEWLLEQWQRLDDWLDARGEPGAQRRTA
jgi:1-acyl-sn-glycerol-3-phosphate acyltransferase